MTPLQIIASVKLAEGEGISNHRMQSAMDAYKDAVDEIAPLLGGFGITLGNYPVLTASIRPADTTIPSGAPVPGFDKANIAEAIAAYSTKILGGDTALPGPGNIEQLLYTFTICDDTVKTLSEYKQVVDSVQTMSFDSFGPSATKHSDIMSMGIREECTKIVNRIKSYTGGFVPENPYFEKTDAAIVGNILTAQGPITGNPNSKYFGTARGIYEETAKKGFKKVSIIHNSLIENVGVTLDMAVPGVDYKYFHTLVSTNWNDGQILSFIKLVKKSAESLISNSETTAKLAGKKLQEWILRREQEGIEGIRNYIQEHIRDVLINQDSFVGNVRYSNMLNSSVWSEDAIKKSLDALTKDQANELFSSLGTRLDISKFKKNSDILDLAKCAVAMPKPLKDSDAPRALKSVFSEPVLDANGIYNLQTIVPEASMASSTSSTQSDLTEEEIAIANVRAIKQSRLEDEIGFSLQDFKKSFANIKGFQNVYDIRELANLLRTIETDLPYGASTEIIDNLSDVMPSDILVSLESITGTKLDISILDMLGSAVGLNKQVEYWETAKNSILELKNKSTVNSSTQELIDAQEAYDLAVSTILDEYSLLYDVSGYDPDFIFTSSNGSKLTLIQRILPYTNGYPDHYSILQYAIDNSTLGGQALLASLVEQRNIVKLQRVGFKPVNNIDTNAYVSENPLAPKINVIDNNPSSTK